jgi:hypothetical protein
LAGLRLAIPIGVITGRRVVTRGTLGPVGVLGSASSTVRRYAGVAGTVPILGTALGTATRIGAATGPGVVTVTARSGAPKGSTIVVACLGTATGKAFRKTTINAPVPVVVTALGRRLTAGRAVGTAVVLARVRSARFWQITPPTAADYLNGHSVARYHSQPAQAFYLGPRSRALYDSGVPEAIPWMAGQMRGSIRAQLVDANGPIPGLASATGGYFTARRQADGLGQVYRPVTIEDAVQSIVRYDPQPGDLLARPADEWLVVHGGLPRTCLTRVRSRLDVAPLKTLPLTRNDPPTARSEPKCGP